MTNAKRIWEIFPEAFKVIKKSHDEFEMTGSGHDVYHAARVGDIAYQIALETWKDASKAELAGLAGLCHNADRMISKNGTDPSEVGIMDLVRKWLDETDLDQEARDTVINAVLKHDQKNDQNDPDLLVALKDADRIVNLDPDSIIRCGQFLHTLPSIDYTHFVSSPTATYKKPESVARDIASSLNWVDPKSGVCIRTEVGLNMARERSDLIKNYLEALKKQLEAEGVLPTPF